MSPEYRAPERFRDDLRDALLQHAATLQGCGPRPAGGSGTNSRSVGPRVVGRRLVPALALAGLVAAVILLLRSGGALGPQPATAAGVLRASAAAIDRLGGSRALGPDDYFYTRIAVWWRYAGFSPRPYIVRSVQEDWLARDGRGRSRYEVLGLGGAGVSRGLPLTRSQDVQLRQPRSRPFILSAVPSTGILASYNQLRSLPTEPARLEAAMNDLVARYHVDELFPQRDVRTAIRFEIVRGLAEAPTSASLRAALYRVLAATPGISLLGPRRDSIGRYGTAVAVTVGDVDLELIIDPATGELLQTSRTLLHRSKLYFDGTQPPGLINRATYIASGIVASTHARVP